MNILGYSAAVGTNSKAMRGCCKYLKYAIIYIDRDYLYALQTNRVFYKIIVGFQSDITCFLFYWYISE
ncbi:MAG: hypothetical protein HPY66_2017 [Firmicutes bacterium]|nr:hypothetical protein [Bacillota bacterium]